MNVTVRTETYAFMKLQRVWKLQLLNLQNGLNNFKPHELAIASVASENELDWHSVERIPRQGADVAISLLQTKHQVTHLPCGVRRCPCLTVTLT